jgi:hypothetical protein
VVAARAKDEEVVDDDLDPDEAAVLGKGKSIEDRAKDGEHEEEEDTGQFVIAGSGSGLTLNAGGRRPDVSEAKLAAIPLAIKGEFKKGDTMRLIVDVICTGVNVKDEMKSGEIQRTRRTHHFTPVAVEPIAT